jgi:hypothetical protein
MWKNQWFPNSDDPNTGPSKSMAVTTAVSLFFSCSSLGKFRKNDRRTGTTEIGLGPKRVGNKRMVV